jgi:hypothetical protein
MMVKKYISIIGIVAAASLIFNCSGTTISERGLLLDRNWGRSYETAFYNQMLNPDADKNLEPVLDIEGPAAEHTIDKYTESFKETKTKEVVNVLQLQ